MKKVLRGDRKIGEKIKEERRRLGLSQMKLGELVGVTYQQVQKYERGEDRITVERLRQISQALRVPLSSLLSGHPPVIQEVSPAYLKLGDLTTEETSLIQAFRRIKDPACRKLIFSMATLGSRVYPKKE